MKGKNELAAARAPTFSSQPKAQSRVKDFEKTL